jgi:hypothetical protein
LPVQPTKPPARFKVTADGEGIVSHVGAALLAELADRLGLTRELGRRANRGLRRGAHDRGAVLRDLVVMLADGGDAFSDLRVLRDQPELFGEVASVPTAWRVVAEEVAGDPRGVAALWSALARTREVAWAHGAAPVGPLVIDLDATLVTAHSDKQGARPTWKRGFGFHPLLCYLDRGDGTGEALAGILRPGNAGSNTAADHLDVLKLALLALPKPTRTGPVLVRTDSAGATHALVGAIHKRGLQFSIGFSTATSGSGLRSWPRPSRPGCPRRIRTATSALAPGCASLTAWTLPAGPRVLGCSAAASGPTLAPRPR